MTLAVFNNPPECIQGRLIVLYKEPHILCVVKFVIDILLDLNNISTHVFKIERDCYPKEQSDGV